MLSAQTVGRADTQSMGARGCLNAAVVACGIVIAGANVMAVARAAAVHVQQMREWCDGQLDSGAHDGTENNEGASPLEGAFLPGLVSVL